HGEDPEREFLLSDAIGGIVSSGVADVFVHASEEPWFGMTYKDDRARVEAHIAELVEQGEYPKSLRHAMQPVDPREPETVDETVDEVFGSSDEPVEKVRDPGVVEAEGSNEPGTSVEPIGHSHAPDEDDGSDGPEAADKPDTQDWIG
ncbi:MAG: hypothetical protein JJE01_15335, partial [Gemmatimonadetes bacterium]|nr:hypothetical protein [Gemmatimonadota bacterium]